METKHIIVLIAGGIAIAGISYYLGKKSTSESGNLFSNAIGIQPGCEPIPAKPVVPIQDGMTEVTQHKLQALNNYADYMKQLYMNCCNKKAVRK